MVKVATTFCSVANLSHQCPILMLCFFFFFWGGGGGGRTGDPLHFEFAMSLHPEVKSTVGSKGRRHWTRLPPEDASRIRTLADSRLAMVSNYHFDCRFTWPSSTTNIYGEHLQ